jgi:hypothetical protein
MWAKPACLLGWDSVLKKYADRFLYFFLFLLAKLFFSVATFSSVLSSAASRL